MLEKPNLEDALIVSVLREQYDLDVIQAKFLAIGNDANSAAYQAATADGTHYFLKLRKGGFDEEAVAVPHFLNQHGIRQVMAPIETRARELWTRIGPFYAALYPFVEGHNGFEIDMADRYWIELGSAMQAIHTAQLPDALMAQMPRETYTPFWRECAQLSHDKIISGAHNELHEPAAVELNACWLAHADEIALILARTHQLAPLMRQRDWPLVLCHTDIHAGNILISTTGEFFIVDWDMPVLAPKERDLMFLGAGIGGVWKGPREEALFYKGYGPTQVNAVAIAYFRYERVIQDMVEFYKQIFLSDAIAEDKADGVRFFSESFNPGSVIEIAHQSYAMLDFSAA